jgi:RHS repeat-associated protein
MSSSPTQGYVGFQGDVTDSLTGHVDMRSRYYEPSLGRFDTRDVIFGDSDSPTSLNQYGHAGDEPVVFTDPSGRRPQCISLDTADCQNDVVEKWSNAVNEHAQRTRPSVSEPEPYTPPVSSRFQCGPWRRSMEGSARSFIGSRLLDTTSQPEGTPPLYKSIVRGGGNRRH